MKIFGITLILLLVGLIELNAQVIKDPLLAFYHEEVGGLSDESDITVIEADLTGDGKSYYLITDGAPGVHGDYGWGLYSPVHQGEYAKAFYDYVGPIPIYIGYVRDIKRIACIVIGGKHSDVITAYYLDHGEIVSVPLSENADEYKRKNPKYFPKTPNFKLKHYTLKELQQKYGKIMGPVGSKLREGK